MGCVGMDWWGCSGCDGFGRAGCGRRDGGDNDFALIDIFQVFIIKKSLQDKLLWPCNLNFWNGVSIECAVLLAKGRLQEVSESLGFRV